MNVEAWVRKANLRLFDLIVDSPPDVVMVVATEGIRAGTLAQLKVSCPKTLLYCLYPDTPHNLTQDRISCIPFFDRVFVVSSEWRRPFEKLGAAQVQYLPLAADPVLHSPIEDVTETCDVGFIGTWSPQREAFLERLARFDLRIWGSDYWKTRVRKDSPLSSKWAGTEVTGTDYSGACASTKVMLNIIHPIGWPGPNMRVFEHAAARVFSLTTRTPAVLDIFEEGNTIECFSDVEEAEEKLLRYLADDHGRRSIASAAYRFVTESGHTYVDRAGTLMRWIDEDQTT